jgi:hypothetical protein
MSNPALNVINLFLIKIIFLLFKCKFLPYVGPITELLTAITELAHQNISAFSNMLHISRSISLSTSIPRLKHFFHTLILPFLGNVQHVKRGVDYNKQFCFQLSLSLCTMFFLFKSLPRFFYFWYIYHTAYYVNYIVILLRIVTLLWYIHALIKDWKIISALFHVLSIFSRKMAV